MKGKTCPVCGEFGTGYPHFDCMAEAGERLSAATARAERAEQALANVVLTMADALRDIERGRFYDAEATLQRALAPEGAPDA